MAKHHKFYEASEAKNRVEGRYLVVLQNTTLPGEVDALRDSLLESSEYVADLHVERTIRRVLRAFALQVRDDGQELRGMKSARERRRFKLSAILESNAVAYVEEVRRVLFCEQSRAISSSEKPQWSNLLRAISLSLSTIAMQMARSK